MAALMVRTDPTAIRRSRAAAGLTQAVVAAHAGISVPYLSNLETGTRTTVRRSILQAIADRLGVALDDLTAADDTPATAA